MADLPDIANGAKAEEISYGGEAQSQFQKFIRSQADSDKTDKDPVL